MRISGKTYRIKSGRRFTLFIAFTIVFLVMISNTLLGLNNVSSLTQREYIEIEVQYGDNLWNISKKYMGADNDIRKSVHTLCQLNDISAHELQAGQKLIIPVN